MKIFYITFKHDYTTSWKPTRRLSCVYDTTYLPLVKIAEERGHTIRPFWTDESILQKGEAGMAEELCNAIITEKPDICFFDSGMGESLKASFLERIKKESPAITVYICGDDSWNFDHESKHFAPYFSWVVTCYSGAVPRYKRLGCENVVSWQGGANTDLLKPSNLPRDIDVSFVGTWAPPRDRMIKELKEAGIDVFVRGNGWPEGGVSSEELVSIISRSKISLSLNLAPLYLNWRSIARLFFRRAHLGEKGSKIKLDVLNFVDNVKTLWQKRIPNIKGKQFEIPACGAMEIARHADNLQDYYELGEEIVIYENEKDLVEKIKYYLTHDEEREVIAKRGYERTIRDHSTERRLEDIFKMIGRPL